MLMLKLTFPELDWETDVNTRAALLILEFSSNTRGAQKFLLMSRSSVMILLGVVSHREMLDISRWPNTKEISSQNIPLIIPQDDSTQNENVSLRSF
jgi:hypothetical protein